MTPTKIYEFTLTANGSHRLQVGGQYFKVISATGAVSVTSNFGTMSPLSSGQGLEKTPFDYLYITDLSGASNSLQVLIGDKNFIDTRITGSVTFAPLGATFVNTAPAVTNAVGGVTLLAANAARKYLLVQNNNLTGDIWVRLDGGVPTAAAPAVKLAMGGGAIELSTVVPSGAVKAIGTIANNPDVTVVEG